MQNNCPPNKERMAKPVVFLVGEDSEVKTDSVGQRYSYDHDDSIWPNSQRVMQQQQQAKTTPRWDAVTITQCRQLCIRKGMIQGAMVVRRPLPGSGADWRTTSPYQWGIIMELHTFIYGQDHTDYHPLKVRWVCPQYHEGVVEESFFPGDLFLIHRRPDEAELKLDFERQKDADA